MYIQYTVKKLASWIVCLLVFASIWFETNKEMSISNNGLCFWIEIYFLETFRFTINVCFTFYALSNSILHLLNVNFETIFVVCKGFIRYVSVWEEWNINGPLEFGGSGGCSSSSSSIWDRTELERTDTAPFHVSTSSPASIALSTVRSVLLGRGRRAGDVVRHAVREQSVLGRRDLFCPLLGARLGHSMLRLHSVHHAHVRHWTQPVPLSRAAHHLPQLMLSHGRLRLYAWLQPSRLEFTRCVFIFVFFLVYSIIIETKHGQVETW